MNDRYLYRAKRTDNGEWVEGFLWKEKYNSNKIFISCFPYKDDNEEVFVVDKNTIGQCTGKLDKNNNLIFENDLVNANGTVYVCRFDEDNFAWEFQNHDETIGICCFFPIDIEIVGNTYDNTELLEVGE